MSDKLEALKAAALAATPGPWMAFLSGDTFAVHTPSDKHCGDIVNWPGFDGSKNAANNAAFIAAVNPAVVLELLAALEEANKRAEAESVGADKSAVNAVEWMKRANAAEQREEHLKATVDVLSAKNAELERRLQQPINLPPEIDPADVFVSRVYDCAEVESAIRAAGFKADGK